MTRDELDQFLKSLDSQDDALVRWDRGMPKPEQPKSQRRLDTSPVDWATVIDERVAAERERTSAILVELIAQMQEEAADGLERATRNLTAELADLKATLAELRLVLASDRTKPLDLPQLPRSARTH